MKDEKFEITARNFINENTQTFTFTAASGKAIHNLKSWYSDPNMIGRHFLVYSSKAPRIKRQYTICSSMNPRVKAELIKLADSAIKSGQPVFDSTVLLGQDQSSIDLTLKTYGVRKGLATRIHSTGEGPSRLDATHVAPSDEDRQVEVG